MDGINKNKELNTELTIVYRHLRKLGIAPADEDVVQETVYRYLLYRYYPDLIDTQLSNTGSVKFSL
ncbi:hypothetical protein [Neobacillus sp. PS3-40]|uniref:hypothetical protein n=1 Tax=Neobacillus sp. PS3-40 TaxID=3070679 RepID=UPI0027DF0AAE|nr:hypothetical protein [Neobacillus sp. PS3-40]WML44330.1 hypothetical protein RCG20_21620 [Neobacillus sp. PS3-40]